MKQFYLKFYTLLLCLVIGGGNLWAEDAPVNAVLWADNFGNTEGDGQTTFSKIETFVGDYKYGGRTGYSSNATSVTYTGDNNVRLSQASGTNVTDTHLWFVKQGKGEFTTSAINLYGAKKVNFSFSRSKGLTIVKYSFNGTIWNTLWEESSTAAQENKNADIVTENHEVVYLKIIEGNNSNNLRVDNLSLKVVTASGNNTQPTEKKDLSPFSKDSYTLAAGAEGNISDLVSIPSDYDGVITYISNDEDVIIIDSDGSYLVGDAGTATISATASETSTYKAVSQEVTIKVVANYTITWNVNGETTTTQVQEGSQIDFADPNNTTIEGKQFVGWVSEEITGITDVAPSFITSATASKDIIYYAVYANSIGGEEYLTKITDAKDIKNGVYAIISFDEDFYLPNASSTSGAPIVGSVISENGKIRIKDDMKWKLSINNDGITFESFANTSLKLWGSDTNEGIRVTVTSTKTKATNIWSVKSTNDYGLVLYASSIGRYLSTYLANDWRNYTSTSATNRAANLYKVSGGVSCSNYCTTVPKQQTLSLVAELGSNYYATFSSDKAVEFENEVVYTVSASGTALTMKPVASKQVPANTGVLIKSENNAENYFEIDSADELNGNMLKAASTPMEGSYSFYKLAYGNYSEKTGLGFYYGEEDGEAFKCKVGTAYLAVPTGSNVKSFVFADDATSVKSVAVPTVDANAPVYNMAGQRVSANTKGIVFQNGKKYFNK